MNGETANSFDLQMKDRVAQFFEKVWKLVCKVKVRRRKHVLQLCETLSLGEKRMLAIIQCEEHRLLIGATGDSISLLLRLNNIRKEKSERNTPEEMISTNGLVQ